MAFEFLRGLLAGDQSGDFLTSGESWKEKRHAFLQKFPEKLEVSEMGFRFLSCIRVLGRGRLSWQRLSAM